MVAKQKQVCCYFCRFVLNRIHGHSFFYWWSFVQRSLVWFPTFPSEKYTAMIKWFTTIWLTKLFSLRLVDQTRTHTHTKAHTHTHADSLTHTHAHKHSHIHTHTHTYSHTKSFDWWVWKLQNSFWSCEQRFSLSLS